MRLRSNSGTNLYTVNTGLMIYLTKKTYSNINLLCESKVFAGIFKLNLGVL
jgi:hypothetical protein